MCCDIRILSRGAPTSLIGFSAGPANHFDISKSLSPNHKQYSYRILTREKREEKDFDLYRKVLRDLISRLE